MTKVLPRYRSINKASYGVRGGCTSGSSGYIVGGEPFLCLCAATQMLGDQIIDGFQLSLTREFILTKK